MEKKERKEALNKYKKEEQQKLLSILPMSKEELEEFFNFLDKQLSNGVEGGSFDLTEKFCKEKGLEFVKVKEWAGVLGGFDDEEILWNCEDPYEFLLKNG